MTHINTKQTLLADQPPNIALPKGQGTYPGALLCPCCGGMHLHQADTKRGVKYCGDGISIKFWCEGCDGDPDLVIEQHKGETYIYWASYAKREAF